MPIDGRCIKCFEKTYDRLLNKFPFSSTQKSEFLKYFCLIMGKSSNMSSPEIQRELFNKLQKLNGISDLFFEEKRQSNYVALKLYEEWKPKVFASNNSFDLALRLAIAGNIMDYGANHNFNIHKTIDTVLYVKFAIDYSFLLKQRIKDAKNILYLGDNAGEIVFDKLFIEIINHNNLTYVVRGGNIINDITIKDANEIGMNIITNVISNGYNAPSTVLEKSSQEFKDYFNSADLIISKGQGNLEGLISLNDKRIFFLLMVKCDVISEILGVKKESFIVFNQNK